MGFDIADYPNAYAQYENEVTLPLHTRLTDEDVEYLKEHPDKAKEYYYDNLMQQDAIQKTSINKYYYVSTKEGKS